MAFTKKDKVSEVTPCLTYDHLHRDENGNAIVFKYPMRRQRVAEADEDKLLKSSGQQTDLDRFCKLLVKPPQGFKDFPLSNGEFQERFKDELKDVPAGTDVSEAAQTLSVIIDNRPLATRAKEYFADEDIDYFVTDALLAYNAIIYPWFFRAT